MADADAPAPVPHPPAERFPFLRLLRCPALAGNPKSLMLAALGVWAWGLGGKALDLAFDRPAPPSPARGPSDLGQWTGLVGRVVEPARRVLEPFVTAFDPSADARTFLHAAASSLWTILVWGLFGGAIARVAVVRLATGDRLKLGEALRFAAGKLVPLVGTPVVPLLGVVVAAAPVAAFGLLYRVPGGATVAGLLAFLPLIGGLLLALVVLGLAAGWPLMPASVAAEAEDGFDAMSRAYAYVHQRPWQYAGYAAVATLAGAAGLAVVDLFARLVLRLTAWSLAFGGPADTVVPLFSPQANPASTPHAFWVAVVGLLVTAWAYSYLWTAASAAYLLLRREVDGTPLSSVAYTPRPSALFDAPTSHESKAVATPTPAQPAGTPALVTGREPGEVTGV